MVIILQWNSFLYGWCVYYVSLITKAVLILVAFWCILWGESSIRGSTMDPLYWGQVMRNCDTFHYNEVIMGAIASQITSLTIVYSIVYSDADQRKHQSSASLAFVWGIHRGPVNSPHKWPVTRKMFPFDDVIMLRWLCENMLNKCWSRRWSHPGCWLYVYM